MKVFLVAVSLAAACLVQCRAVNPIEKVLSMLSNLEGKIVKEGEAAQKTYTEFAEWCEDRSRNLGFEIKDGKAEVADNKATIESSTADIASQQAKIEELGDALSVDDADLQAATKIRTSEEADFKATEKDLMETINILERAILILEKEMKKGGAAMVQVQKAGNNIAQALSALVDASLIGSQDAEKLSALVQESNRDDDADAEAPASSVYKGHSGGIIETLEGLLDKAKDSLAKARATESANSHNFAMLKQSLENEIKIGNDDMAKTRKALATSQQTKATAGGDLGVASKDLGEDTATLQTLHQDCLRKSRDFEAETKSRGEELKALAEAKKVIAEATAGADTIAYGLEQVSFFQSSSIRTGSDNSLHSTADLANFEAVRLVRDLARKTGDAALTQLASRMAMAIRRAKAGDDPFAKVKELIKNMIETLLGDAQSDASHKAYCDKELGESAEKKAQKTATIDKLSTQIDSMSAKSAQLKEQVAKLQRELAGVAKSQSEMNEIRAEEKATFKTNKAEMEEGIAGIKTALKVLRDYYASEGKAHESADGAGGGIVGLLEVVESDFTKGLSEMSVTEQTAQSEFDKETRSNEISKTTKEQSVKYKTKEFKGLDQSIAEATSDRSTTQEELDSIMQYLGKLDDICIAKAEPYAERKRRREEEIAGLKEALSILNGEAVLLQRQAALRGTHRH